MNMHHIEETREQLGLAFGCSAYWRGEVATRYPDDDRNRAASGELETLESSVGMNSTNFSQSKTK
jgi:hypothetical protein